MKKHILISRGSGWWRRVFVSIGGDIYHFHVSAGPFFIGMERKGSS